MLWHTIVDQPIPGAEIARARKCVKRDKSNVTWNSFWKIMMEFNFMCYVATMELVKLDIKKQHLFIRC